ncbi:MAG TPA: DUF2314 domain-containing protein [Bacteroidia bacterium]|nr:DUF2314 domain-containing protein [Bacteroidia bacterium]
MSYTKREESSNVFDAATGDAQMNWAMEKARHTIGYFRESLAAPAEEQFGFSLKVRIEDGSAVEHMWLTDLSLDEDGLFYGTLDSDPVTVQNVKSGTRIGIPVDVISDWLIVEDGRLIGGYTIRVYRESLTPEERQEFDKGFGVKFDYGVDYFTHDMKTPEGAILCLEDAYSEGNLEAALACKDFETEARMLLERLPNFEGQVDELVGTTAETLRLSFEAHFRAGAMPNFDGILHAFPEREFLDPDTVLVSEICYHPDGKLTLDRLLVTRHGDEWRVGPPMNQDEEDEA